MIFKIHAPNATWFCFRQPKPVKTHMRGRVRWWHAHRSRPADGTYLVVRTGCFSIFLENGRAEALEKGSDRAMHEVPSGRTGPTWPIESIISNHKNCYDQYSLKNRVFPRPLAPPASGSKAMSGLLSFCSTANAIQPSTD